jgi:hypothetical protein
VPRQIELSLHLGPHKTATTHLQRSILSHQEDIIAAGVRTYGPDYLRQRGRNIPNLFGLTRWGARRAARREPMDQLKFLAKSGWRVLLSEENFLGQLHRDDGTLAMPVYSEAADRIADLASNFPGVSVRVFLATRRPDTFLESAYSQTLFAGKFLTPEDFVSQHRPDQVDWSVMMASISAIPNVSLHVWRYEDYHEVFQTLMQRMLRWKLGGTVKPFKRPLHAGLSVQAVEQVMAWAAEGREGALALDARKLLPVGEGRPRFTLFDQVTKDAATADYQRQFEAICQLPAIEVIRPAGSASDGKG